LVRGRERPEHDRATGERNGANAHRLLPREDRDRRERNGDLDGATPQGVCVRCLSGYDAVTERAGSRHQVPKKNVPARVQGAIQ
jgi:hypothetical protein